MAKLLLFFGASADVLPYAMDYMGITLSGFLFLSLSLAANNMIRAEGRPRAAMYSMIIGAAINIVLDGILMAGLNMGVRGAAIAKLTSQAISCIYISAYLRYAKSIYCKSFKTFTLKINLIKEILKSGFPSFIMAVVDSVIYPVFDRAIIHYGSDMHLAVMGIGIRLIDFTSIPIIGITQGFFTIVSFNYGTKRYARVKTVLKEALAWTTSIAAFAMVLMFLFTEPLLRVATDDDAPIDLRILPIRIIVVLFFCIRGPSRGWKFFPSDRESTSSCYHQRLKTDRIFNTSCIDPALFLRTRGHLVCAAL